MLFPLLVTSISIHSQHGDISKLLKDGLDFDQFVSMVGLGFLLKIIPKGALLLSNVFLRPNTPTIIHYIESCSLNAVSMRAVSNMLM